VVESADGVAVPGDSLQLSKLETRWSKAFPSAKSRFWEKRALIDDVTTVRLDAMPCGCLVSGFIDANGGLLERRVPVWFISRFA